jgi:hypothetical protein
MPDLRVDWFKRRHPFFQDHERVACHEQVQMALLNIFKLV